MTTFGKLRHQIYSTLSEQYSNKELFKDTFKKINTILDENKNLRKVFNIYTDLEKKTITKKEVASEFVIEAINEIKILMNESFYDGVTKLEKIVGKTECEQNSITESIDKLVYKEGYDTLVERIDSKHHLITHLLEEKETVESVGAHSPSILNSLLTTKFNERFSNMNESEKEAFNSLMSLNKDEVKNRVSELKTTLSESVEKLSDVTELSEMLPEVKKSINESGNTILDLYKLEELKKNLS